MESQICFIQNDLWVDIFVFCLWFHQDSHSFRDAFHISLKEWKRLRLVCFEFNSLLISDIFFQKQIIIARRLLFQNSIPIDCFNQILIHTGELKRKRLQQDIKSTQNVIKSLKQKLERYEEVLPFFANKFDERTLQLVEILSKRKIDYHPISGADLDLMRNTGYLLPEDLEQDCE
jgi:hypothetical protein